MKHYTGEDIVRIVNENDIEFIRLQFTDIFGQLKNVAVTRSQISRAVLRVDGCHGRIANVSRSGRRY